MAKGKKYEFRVKQENTCWTTEIVRKVTAKRTIVSKRQKGFSSESEAQEWGESELKAILQSVHERNLQRAQQDEQKSVE
jgi:hypothetical protein